MSKDAKNVPALRFKGYSDAWEKRKLGDILNYEQPTPYIVRSENYQNSFPTPVLTAGKSLLLGYTNETNGIKSASKSSPVIIFDDFTTSSHLIDFPFKIKSSAMKILSPSNNDSDIYFSFGLLFSINYVSKNHERHWISQFSNFRVQVPSVHEQACVSRVLLNVTDLIAATQHKIDALEQAKKALLQRLFDQSWRFKGYSDPWEKRKVSDYLCESRIPGSNGLKAKKLTVKLWGKGVVPKNETYSGSIKTKYYVRSANQLIYGKLDFLHAAFGIVPQSLDGWESTIDSPAFDVNTSIGNAAFLLALFLKPNFYLREGIRANGSRKAKRIHEDTFLSMSISAPQRKEQNQIAMVLDKTEFLIAATQSRLSSLELLKKALLQDLFI